MMVGRERMGGQTWIVGVDGSENSIQRSNGRFGIHTVGAWSRAGWIRADLEDADTDIDAALVEFHAAVGEVEKARSESGRTERSFVRDHPTTALLEASSVADLLVVGERGRRGLKAALLGSAATEVLHRSDRPIVVVPINE